MKIKQLVVVAGPTAVGMSVFFLKRLTHQPSIELCGQLGLRCDKWWQVNARQFDSDAPQPFASPPPDHVALHYEITRTWQRPYDHADDPGLKLLQFADKRIFVTLWASTRPMQHQELATSLARHHHSLVGKTASPETSQADGFF